MGILLFSIFLTGHIAQCISVVHSLSKLSYHPVCLVIRLPHSLVYYRSVQGLILVHPLTVASFTVSQL